MKKDRYPVLDRPAIKLAILGGMLMAAIHGPSWADTGRPRQPGHDDMRVEAAKLSTITRDLASDRYEGREPGTPGEQRTIAYLIRRFQALGLKPADPNGSWTQKVSLLKTRLEGAPQLSFSTRSGIVPLNYPSEMSGGTDSSAPDIALKDIPVVFVGYGAHAPERGWDDFKNVDLTNKIAIFLVNDPDFGATPQDDAYGRFGGPTMTLYGRWSNKLSEAARRGAAAAFVIHETDAAGYGWNVAQASEGVSYALDRESGSNEGRLAIKGWISRPAAEKIFAAVGLDFETVKRGARSAAFQPILLDATASIAAKVSSERLTSHNVLAKIAGSTAPDEVIIVGAHWDALGVKTEGGKRIIRPGAVDNALGVAGVLEVARGFAQGPRPRRSLIFAAWTAEERGLLGSEYYAAHPLFPLERTVANLTFDTLQTAGPSRNFVLIGMGQNDLEDGLLRAAAEQGRTVSREQYPERGLYYRSDHMGFAKRGVPALLSMALGGGVDLVNGGAKAGSDWVTDYTTRCYHQACDTWSPKWDLRGAAQDVDLFYRVARDLAHGADWPRWKPGSEFLQRRALSDDQRRPR